jgi:chitinase
MPLFFRILSAGSTRLAVICMLLGICGVLLPIQAKHLPAKREVIAYVFKRNDVIQPGEIAAQKLTRINYAFALIKDGKIVNGYANDDQNLTALVALKKDNPALQVLISVGGWLGSGNFSDMALTAETRRVFIDSVIDFLDRNHLDGLDVDWEYPGLAGAGNVFRPEDKQNYTLLLQELRESFTAHEKKIHRQLLLTIAAGALDEFLEHTEMAKVREFVDTVNLMSYDYYVPGPDSITGHNAPLFTNPADPKKTSADGSVRDFEKAGVPASKLVLGVPFYGHIWGEVEDKAHGLFQHGQRVPNAFVRYDQIAGQIARDGLTRYWDPAASVPYLYSPQSKIFVSYDDPESMALKCKFVRNRKLAGMMFWEYASDTTGALLDTINRELWNPAAKEKN